MMVGHKIKNYLKENGISQTYLSKKTEISLPKLNMALNGSRKMSLDEYAAICEALSLHTDYFLKR